MTTYTFVPKSSTTSVDWNDPTVWSGGVVPNAPDADVIIPTTTVLATGEPYVSSITLTGNIAIESLGISENDLVLDGTLSISHALTLSTGSVIETETSLTAGSIDNGTVIEGAGEIDSTGAFTNSGEVDGTGLTVTAGSLNNTGTLTASFGVFTVDVASGGFANLSGSTLTGGTYTALAGGATHGVGTLDLNIGGVIAVDAATITEEDNGFINSFDSASGTYVSLDSSLHTIAATGTLSLGGQTDSFGALTVDGVLTLAGETLVSTGLAIGADGSVSGTGTISGPVVNDGTIVAGLPPGSNSFANTLEVSAPVTGTGTFEIAAAQEFPEEQIQGATLELDGAASQNVGFLDSHGLLALKSPSTYSGTLAPTGAGDQIELVGVSDASVTGYSYSGNASGGTLTIDLPTGNLSYKFSGDFDKQSFSLTAGPQVLSSDPPTLLVTNEGSAAPTIANAGGLVHRAMLTITGSVEPGDAGQTVSIFDGSTLLGTTAAGTDGSWSDTVTLSNQGANVVTAKVTDAEATVHTSAPVTYTLTPAPSFSDLNGDGRSDILFRNGAGVSYLWEMNDTTVLHGATTSTQVGENWQIKGIADFNGDGTSDLVWAYDNTANAADPLNGTTYMTLQNGAAATAGSGVVVQTSTDWQVAGVGDFDDDGKADILYRNSMTGETYIDLMNGASVQPGSDLTSEQVTDPNWRIAAVADFNGDGSSDILWRYDDTANAADSLNGLTYLWTMNGTTVVSQGEISQEPGSPDWAVAGTGDFDGNGTADILFRYDNTANAADPLNGMTYVDFMNGTTVTSGAPTQWQVGEDWVVASVGDFNHDGKADILFQQPSTGGTTYIWDMNGTQVASSGLTSEQSGPGWSVQTGVPRS